MEARCKTVDGRPARCDVLRLNGNAIAIARDSWGDEFRCRFTLGARDPDEMIWSAGFMLATSGSPLNGYAVAADDDVQGIVVIDQELRSSKASPSRAIVYVPYLATAPWNRAFGTYPGRFRGIGRLLVAQAIAEAEDFGAQGRIGLHSFASACPFYERLGFRNLGIDPVQRGMYYFELDPGIATVVDVGRGEIGRADCSG